MILLCYDGSASARRAVSTARQTLRADHIVLVHVWTPPQKVLADAFSTRDSGNTATQTQLDSMAERRADEVAEDGKKLAAELGLAVEVRQAPSQSSVWRTILEVADDLDAELIVAGTHGTTAVDETPLGSVSHGLVHHSERPVLIVPAGKRPA